MQIVQRPWGVAASGTATVSAAPDVVRVRFAVTRTERRPAAAFAAAGQAVEAVRAIVREHGVPDTAVERSQLDLRTVSDYPDGRQTLIGYQCRAGFGIESADLDGVQPLLVALVDAGVDEVGAVEFGLSEGQADQLRAQARRRAVAEARSTAQLYAEAAGIELGGVLHLEDVGEHVPAVHLVAARDAAAGGSDLAPGRVVVSASVVIGFGIVRQ